MFKFKKVSLLALILTLGIYGCGGGGAGKDSITTTITPGTSGTSGTSTTSGTSGSSGTSTSVGTGTCTTLLAWDQPLQKTDGTPLTSADIAGYRVYYGNSSGTYTGTPVTVTGATQTTYTLNGLTCNQTYYFTITAYDITGTESNYSTEVSKVL